MAAVIRGLTVRQPWAWAIAHAGKDVENRTWAPPNNLLGGYLAIHAGKTLDVEAKQELQDAIRFQTRPELALPDDLSVLHNMPTGAIVAVVRLLGVARQGTETVTTYTASSSYGAIGPDWDSPWLNRRAGTFGWILDQLVVLPNPVPCRGMQGLWTLNAQTLVAVRNEWARALAGKTVA